jgi:transposase InsO family protein
MPWKKTIPEEEIKRFVLLAKSGRISVSELCADFGISRKTGYKHLERYEQEGLRGLEGRSRRPMRSPTRTEAAVEELIIAERKAHPRWGPKKLGAILGLKHGMESPPAESTIGAILQRSGLSQRRRRRPGIYPARPRLLTEADHPNHVWAVDFKGWFILGNGQRCDPLTVCDRYSRYVIECRAQCSQTHVDTLRNFRNIMRYHGLPEIIRVDNGTPFASNGTRGALAPECVVD